MIGYFIPGVRHLTAYFAGVSNLTLWLLFVRLRWCAHLDKCFYWAWLEVRREVALR